MGCKGNPPTFAGVRAPAVLVTGASRGIGLEFVGFRGDDAGW